MFFQVFIFLQCSFAIKLVQSVNFCCIFCKVVLQAKLLRSVVLWTMHVPAKPILSSRIWVWSAFWDACSWSRKWLHYYSIISLHYYIITKEIEPGSSRPILTDFHARSQEKCEGNPANGLQTSSHLFGSGISIDEQRKLELQGSRQVFIDFQVES